MPRSRPSFAATRRMPRPSERFAVEGLEQRLALSNVHWDGGGGDMLWSNPLNWSADVLPGPDDDVALNDGTLTGGLPNPGWVIADAGPIEIRSLTFYRALTINSGVDMIVSDLVGGVGLAKAYVNGLLEIGNQAQLRSTIVARVQAGGQLVIGSPDGDRTPASISIENFGRVRLQNLDVDGLYSANGAITNRPGRVVELSDVEHTGGSVTNYGVIRVDRAAGAHSILNAINNFGTLEAHNAHLVANIGQSISGTVAANGPGATIQLIAPDGSSSPSQPSDPLSFLNLELAGTGSITLRGVPYRAIRFGNTVVSGNLFVESSMPIAVVGGRLTVTGTFTQLGDDPEGDFFGPSQISVRGTLNLGGSVRSIFAPLIIEAGGRLETFGPLTLIQSAVTNLGTIARSTPGTTRLLDRLDNRGTIDAEYGRMEVLGPIVQLLSTSPGVHALSAGEWIARNSATLAWPTGTSITALGSAAALGFLGQDSQILGTDSLAESRGRISIAGGREDFLSGPHAAASLANFGTIQKIGGGEVTIAIPIDQRTNANYTGRIEVLRGKLVLVGEDFFNRGTLDVRSGVLKIDLGDAGTLTNTGTIDIGHAGRLGVVGSLSNQDDGTIATEITAPRFGRATITGNLTLDQGTLRATFVGPGFNAGTSRRIISAANRTGSFQNFTTLGLPLSLAAQAVYSGSNVAVRVVNA